ncbi:MAG: hypothetical protein MJB14_18615 [Spirochaetes bacterium]|nr:hypothetical protein [Spirochaetota bacterium]
MFLRSWLISFLLFFGFSLSANVIIKDHWNYVKNQKVQEQNIKFYSNSENEEIDTNPFIDLNNKGENLFRRAEILFFGSLTIISFMGWLSFSIYNTLIYGDSFGVLHPNQFIALYLGSSVLSLSVCVSDLLIRVQKRMKNKRVRFYEITDE